MDSPSLRAAVRSAEAVLDNSPKQAKAVVFSDGSTVVFSDEETGTGRRSSLGRSLSRSPSPSRVRVRSPSPSARQSMRSSLGGSSAAASSAAFSREMEGVRRDLDLERLKRTQQRLMQSTVEETFRELENLRRRHKAVDARAQQLRQENLSLVEQRDTLTDSLTRARERISALTNETSSTERDRDVLERTLSDVKSRLASALSEIESKTIELEAIRFQMDEQTSEGEAAVRTIDALRMRVQELQREKASLAADKKIAESERALYKEQSASLEAEHTRVLEEKMAVAAERRTLEDTVSSLRIRVSELELEASQHDRADAQMSMDMEGMKREETRLKNAVSERDREIIRLTTVEKQYERDMVAWDADRRALADEKEQLSALSRNTVAQLETAQEQFKSKIIALQSAHEREEAAVQQERDDYRARLDAALRELDVLNAEAQRLQGERDAARNEAARLLNVNAMQRDELDETQSALSRSQGATAALRSDVENLELTKRTLEVERDREEASRRHAETLASQRARESQDRIADLEAERSRLIADRARDLQQLSRLSEAESLLDADARVIAALQDTVEEKDRLVSTLERVHQNDSAEQALLRVESGSLRAQRDRLAREVDVKDTVLRVLTSPDRSRSTSPLRSSAAGLRASASAGTSLSPLRRTPPRTYSPSPSASAGRDYTTDRDLADYLQSIDESIARITSPAAGASSSGARYSPGASGALRSSALSSSSLRRSHM